MMQAGLAMSQLGPLTSPVVAQVTYSFADGWRADQLGEGRLSGD